MKNIRLNKFVWIVAVVPVVILIGMNGKFLKTTQTFPITKPIPEIDSRKIILLKYLKDYGSPIATPEYAKIIVDESDANNADFRINVGIMMAESGICTKPLKKYNCYGYMNNRQYHNYEEALIDLTGKVSRQYSSRFGWNLVGMGKAYGAHNPEVWAQNVRVTANKL